MSDITGAGQDARSLAWDEFERAVRSGSAAEIRSAREHLSGLVRT